MRTVTKEQKLYLNERAKGTSRKESVAIAYPNLKPENRGSKAYQLDRSKSIADQLEVIYNNEGVYINTIVRKIKRGLDSDDLSICEKYLKLAIQQLGLEAPKKQELKQEVTATISQQEKDLAQQYIRQQLKNALN